MKKAALFLVCAALIGSAAAQKAPKKPAALPKEVKCAVMKNETAVVADAQKAGLFHDYKGKRYYFCCAGCVPAFKKDPAKYAKGAVGFPIPKTTKKGG